MKRVHCWSHKHLRDVALIMANLPPSCNDRLSSIRSVAKTHLAATRWCRDDHVLVALSSRLEQSALDGVEVLERPNSDRKREAPGRGGENRRYVIVACFFVLCTHAACVTA